MKLQQACEDKLHFILTCPSKRTIVQSTNKLCGKTHLKHFIMLLVGPLAETLPGKGSKILLPVLPSISPKSKPQF
jgi:hypothetical protein